MLQPFFARLGIKMGRDALFDLLADAGMLIRKRKRHMRTTYSDHWMRKWPNQIKNFRPVGPDQLWVSDITYWKTANNDFFISLTTDAWSHKIVGYHVAESLAGIQTLKALQKALSSLQGRSCELIHHSDRGCQYCAAGYVETLQAHGIRISMTESGDPRDNAIAERINGIIKDEYLNHYEIGSITQAEAALETAVQLYNTERPHLSIGMATPEQIHREPILTRRLWKNYYPTKKQQVNLSQD
jgi:transposase InsO family protein